MKLTAIFLALMSFSAFASWNEVECEGKLGTKEVYLEIEQPFPQGSAFTRATLTVTEEGQEKEFYYTVSARRSGGFRNIRYWGAGLDLDVDFWPDNAPRWGRNYRSTLRTSDVDNRASINVECRYPNAF